MTVSTVDFPDRVTAGFPLDPSQQKWNDGSTAGAAQKKKKPREKGKRKKKECLLPIARPRVYAPPTQTAGGVFLFDVQTCPVDRRTCV